MAYLGYSARYVLNSPPKYLENRLTSMKDASYQNYPHVVQKVVVAGQSSDAK
jgi:hypothetical protein